MKLIRYGFAFLCICLIACSSETKPQLTKRDKLSLLIKENDQIFSDVPHINVSDLKELKQEDYLLIDVRTKQEQDISRIPNSINIKNFEKNKQLYKNKTTIFYCTIGYRSALRTKLYHKLGYKSKNLRGSILAWTWEDLPLENSHGQTKQVHVYDKKWDLLPSEYHSNY